MTLAWGAPHLSLPGPTTIPQAVVSAMNRQSIDIHSEEMIALLRKTSKRLKNLVNCSSGLAMYACNGHGVWEAFLANLFTPSDRVLVIVTGTFGLSWAATAAKLGLDVTIAEFGFRNAVDVCKVREYLQSDPQRPIRGILLTHVDTSTSMKTDVHAVRRILDELDHPGLLIVDCIASLGCEYFDFDAWGVDVAIASSQKGLMMAPGLAFAFVSQKAQKFGQINAVSPPYWDWLERINASKMFEYFCGTPPVQLLFGLDKSLSMILDEEGLDASILRQRVLAESVWHAVDYWGASGGIELYVTRPELRSHGVSTLFFGRAVASKIRDFLAYNTGTIVSTSFGFTGKYPFNDDHFLRIGHMGYVNAQQLFGTLATLECAFQALGIEYKLGGITRALEVCANYLTPSNEEVLNPLL